VQKQVEQAGMEKAILQILFPFLERIGILWLTHHINPAQEHLVSNIIRQKLIVAIDRIRIPDTDEPSAILFLPEGEYHEIGLLFVQYLLKRQGVTTWYLGANVPLKDLAFVADLRKNSFLFTHLTSISQGFQFDKFLHHLTEALPGHRVVVSGHVTQSYKKEHACNIELKRSLSEVMVFVNQL
jgi:methanogenic corrinoid protein MtbC1